MNPNSASELKHDFYQIPIIGEVRIDHTKFEGKGTDIGKLIQNIHKSESKIITVQATDDGLEKLNIFKNDFLNVSLMADVKNAEIGVVKLGYKIFVRKIFFEKNWIRLETDSKTNEPLIIDPKTPGFEIIGRVTAIIREL